jgi:hypothetical protein
MKLTFSVKFDAGTARCVLSRPYLCCRDEFYFKTMMLLGKFYWKLSVGKIRFQYRIYVSKPVLATKL